MVWQPVLTFTATGVPSKSSALWTWARLAAAMGSWSNVLKSCSGVLLKSSWKRASTYHRDKHSPGNIQTVLCLWTLCLVCAAVLTSLYLLFKALSSSICRVRMYSGGRRWLKEHRPWPSLMYIPPFLMAPSTMHSAALWWQADISAK